MENGIDLHIHSTYSDGTCTPQQLVQLAKDISLGAMSLTDHDTLEGIPVMRELCRQNQIPFIPGIEISTDYYNKTKGIHKEVHMLGYFVDETNTTLLSYLDEFHHLRNHRNEEMVALLQEHGFSITYKDLLEQNKNAVITRANIARYLLDTNQVKSIKHAFDKYLGDDCCCFVQRKKVSCEKAIQMIHEAGGMAFIAHPPLYRLKEKELETLISHLKSEGLDGIEAVYSTYHNNEEQLMKHFAKEYHLLISGGSDFHGSNKPYLHLGKGRGNLYVPFEIYEKIVESHEQTLL
ncbi:MAG: PHP domain-containing protein [Lachnospiraceae bacterium]|nr:PHP domain-containing protein [Lachnospiraceae bacterium]